MRTVTIEKEVDIDVDLDDYFDEFMNDASDKELIKEIVKRGFIVYEGEALPSPTEFNTPTDLKRHLCDIVNVGYYISNEHLINEIKSKLP